MGCILKDAASYPGQLREGLWPQGSPDHGNFFEWTRCRWTGPRRVIDPALRVSESPGGAVTTIEGITAGWVIGGGASGCGSQTLRVWSFCSDTSSHTLWQPPFGDGQQCFLASGMPGQGIRCDSRSRPPWKAHDLNFGRTLLHIQPLSR